MSPSRASTPQGRSERDPCHSCGIPIFQSSILPQLKQEELHKLLRSNEYPTHVQASHCQEIISSSPAEIERYDVEISRLEAILEQTKHNRALVEDYLRLCRYTISPIRRLPSEILTEIFAFFLPEIPNGMMSSLSFGFSNEEELSRVANVDLLRLSEVCSRWHRLVMGTPFLWSVVGVNSLLWDGPSRGCMMPILQSSLERGNDCPLHLWIQMRGPYDHDVLALIPLLARSSRRWRTVSLSANLNPQLRAFSSVRGNLPLLESLQIGLHGFAWESIATEVTSYFTAAPLLRELCYSGSVTALAELPLQQLELFAYMDVLPQDLDELFSVMARFSHATGCHIGVQVSDGDFLADINSPPITSHVSSLTLLGIGISHTDEAEPMLKKFATGLTLPSLNKLQILGNKYQCFPLPWPHLEFVALSHRSSFHAHLKCLDLESVLITEAELLQTLPELPLITDLTISDHRVVDNEEGCMVLISDSLLQLLTWMPESTCLVPKLSFLETHTLLKFDDTLYRDFVLSRLEPGRNEEGPFEVNIRWYPEYSRELDPGMVMQFTELQEQERLLFSCSESSLFPMSIILDS